MMAFGWLPLAPLNLDANSMAPAGRPFGWRYWPPDQRPTTRVGCGDRRLSIEPLLATNAQE